MKLELLGGPYFSLAVDGYEFPDEEVGPNEDNPVEGFDQGRYLFVTIELKTSDGNWRATEPEMTTTELERLAEWLETVISGQPSKNGVHFTEYDLELSVDQAVSTLNVGLYRRFLPTWVHADHLIVPFPIAQIDLPQAISSIREQLLRFPGRPLPDGI